MPPSWGLTRNPLPVAELAGVEHLLLRPTLLLAADDEAREILAETRRCLSERLGPTDELGALELVFDAAELPRAEARVRDPLTATRLLQSPALRRRGLLPQLLLDQPTQLFVVASGSALEQLAGLELDPKWETTLWLSAPSTSAVFPWLEARRRFHWIHLFPPGHSCAPLLAAELADAEFGAACRSARVNLRQNFPRHQTVTYRDGLRQQFPSGYSTLGSSALAVDHESLRRQVSAGTLRASLAPAAAHAFDSALDELRERPLGAAGPAELSARLQTQSVETGAVWLQASLEVLVGVVAALSARQREIEERLELLPADELRADSALRRARDRANWDGRRAIVLRHALARREGLQAESDRLSQELEGCRRGLRQAAVQRTHLQAEVVALDALRARIRLLADEIEVHPPLHSARSLPCALNWPAFQPLTIGQLQSPELRDELLRATEALPRAHSALRILWQQPDRDALLAGWVAAARPALALSSRPPGFVVVGIPEGDDAEPLQAWLQAHLEVPWSSCRTPDPARLSLHWEVGGFSLLALQPPPPDVPMAPDKLQALEEATEVLLLGELLGLFSQEADGTLVAEEHLGPSRRRHPLGSLTQGPTFLLRQPALRARLLERARTLWSQRLQTSQLAELAELVRALPRRAPAPADTLVGQLQAALLQRWEGTVRATPLVRQLGEEALMQALSA